ncbi:MAG: UDP-glucose 4-epimerase GalE [Crocinitomicaceae bacterium]|nr:UDP-glucose 4-epimerase GalE [Crocinitomicaceae bacterium]
MSEVVLVTGGAGYIGSHACKALKKAGYTPVTVDSLCTGWYESVKYGPFEKVNLLDKQKLNEVFLKFRPSSIMHFAAFSQVGESIKEPEKYWRNNLVGSMNLIDLAATHKCFNFVFSSTCAIYGDHDGILLNESTPQNPKNPYGASKRAVEEMLQNFSLSVSLKYVIFRYFNVAGADPDAEIGEFHKPETHLIPLVLDVIMGKREYITIYGTDYKTIDGTCIRDYVHVSDIIDAHILGMEWISKRGMNRIYNLGSGHGFSVREVIESAQKVTNVTIPVVEGERRHGDSSKLVSDSLLAKKELGWNPNRSNLNQMILDAWKWHQTGLYSQ